MAVLALLSWPLIALVLFSRLPPLLAIIWATLLPYMFLPEAFEVELPGLPDLDKTAIIAGGLILSLLVYRSKLKLAFPDVPGKVESITLRLFIWLTSLIIFVGLFVTVMSNREMLFYGETVIIAARPWDAFSNVVKWFLILVPFWIAMRYMARPEAHQALLRAFVIGGLCYSALMLIEIRLSPQLHTWVYGYFQHSFIQHVRGGYRPIVFMEHGIWVGFFIFMALLSAVGLSKTTKDRKWVWAALWIFIILLWSRNLGAVAVAVLTIGVFLGFGRRAQRWFLCIIAVFVLFFPAFRQAQLVPTQQILNLASSISEDRAQSLSFRFENEDELLAHAWEKKWSGWGGWGRERVYDHRGRYTTTPDGLWIVTLGQRGWIGYLGLFGLLTLPVMWLALSKRIKDIPQPTLALAFIAAGNLIYMIVNATMTPIGLLVFGAISGFVVYGQQNSEGPAAQANSALDRRKPRYSRATPTRAPQRPAGGAVNPYTRA